MWGPRGLWGQLTRGLRVLRNREAEDRQLVEELGHFFAEAEADLVSEGVEPEEARRNVRLRHGDWAMAREAVGTYGWENRAMDLFGDVRLAARRLRRAPVFTAVAVLTLGLGIGAATSIFSVVNPVLLQPLGYPDEDRILSVSGLGDEGVPLPVAFGTYQELVRRGSTFDALSVYRSWQPTLTTGAEPERLEGQRVTAQYFQVLGVPPAIGPGFDAAEDHPTGASVVILSDGLWRDRFGADPGIVGGTIELNSRTYRVVGVMPPGFEDATGGAIRLWSLLQYEPLQPSFMSREWGLHLGMVGRLARGVGLEEARLQLARVAGDPIPQFPRPEWASLIPGFMVRDLRDATAANARSTMLVLMSSVALLLVIACVNVTILLLARGKRRGGELAMRVALGAGWWRLLRQLLAESLLLAGLGGAVGVVLAWVGVSALMSLVPPAFPRLDSIGLDLAALGFALGLTAVVGILVGVGPALSRSQGALMRGVRSAGRGVTGRGWSGQRALVATEVALALVLLVGAGLVLRSTQRLFSVPTGFEASQRVVVQVSATGLEQGDAPVHGFFDQALAAVREVPGVRSAAMTTQMPLSGDVDSYGISVDEPGRREASDGAPFRYAVSPGYLKTMGVPLVGGRSLQETDVWGSPPVAVVSEALADRLFPGRDPLGQRVRVGDPELRPFTIVGVAGDVTQASLEAGFQEAVYVTTHQWHWADRVRWLILEVPGDPMAMAPAIRRAVWSVNSTQPIVRTTSLAALVADSEAQRRFVMIVLGVFAFLAVTLSGVGLYGVTSGSVAERMPEIGLRSALGASREELLGLVIRQGVASIGVGLGVGVIVAALASQILASLLFGVSRLDPVTYVSVIGLLFTVAVLACWVPGVRAAGVDPLQTLKAD